MTEKKTMPTTTMNMGNKKMTKKKMMMMGKRWMKKNRTA
jgi:hypothetical protein